MVSILYAKDFVQNFVSVPKNFVGEHISASGNFGYRKILCIRKGYQLKFFCLTVPKKFVGEPFCVSKKFWYVKFSCIGGRGASRFCRNFLSHSAEKHRGGTILCFRKFGVWENFMHERGYRDFLLKFFSLTVPKNFVGEPFCVSENFWYGKKYG